ncbi:5'-nucleotidase domain-containing protein 1-like [Phytophthora cinnamomi]|uniref:5'-nucleotidase domain-containing protein 1-like n=1 Tax=Phytophthora cinnamomi TaxID=4785 RepID=UPI0035594AAD|nr:5'-nucleotidase domain-containing protein 1-like [Phytophthora cinnamomi]
MRRRKIWLEIVDVEVHKKLKSIIGQNFEFSTRRMTMSSHGSGASSKIPEGEGETSEDDASYLQISLENRVPEIIEAMITDLPIQVNTYNKIIIKQLCLIIASELRTNAEAAKVLSFVLYRDQVPSNRRPCIPTGTESYAIYTDILESCIQLRDPSIYKHMLSIGVDRYVVWMLFQVFISDTLPLVLRVRFLDLVLVRGCVALVSAMLAYLVWRKEALLQARTSTEFVACIKQAHIDWLPNDKLETFWAKCVGMHTQSFLDLYVENSSRMRLKAVTIARQRDVYEPLLIQHQRDIFHHSRYSWIGFDVDHTLVEYRLPYLLRTSFTQAIKELQKNFAGLRTLPPAEWLPSVAQRGIVVDTARGNFLHLGEDGSIQRAYHGSHEISFYSTRVLYGGTVTKDDNICGLLGGSSKLVHLHTAADIIYAPLYAWIVDAFDSGVISMEELGASLYLVPDIVDQPQGNPNDPFLANKAVYVSLSGFALKAARSFYAGAFWKTITTSPDLLIQPNADIVTLLEILKTNLGKQLFILTNGSWTHCNTVMQFAVGRNWMNYFDLVVTEANKEVFFDKFNDTFFSELSVEGVANSETGGGRAPKKVVTMLHRRKVYAHGNVKTLMTFFSENARRPTSAHLIVDKDQRICYFGDHVMQDILLPARFTTMWDLVAIIKEIQTIGQPAESEEVSPCWLTRWIYRSVETTSPDLRSSFFFLGPSGSASYFGKKVCAAATLCLPSVGKLAHCISVLKVGTILQGGRYVPNSELGAIPKRVIAKVRSIDANSSRA